MISKLLITPVDNIINDEIVNNDLIESRFFDCDKDPLTFYNIISKKIRVDTTINVSVFDDLLVESGKHYKILHMLTKNF